MPDALEGLHGVVSPAPVPWLPQTSGWAALGALALAGLAWLAWRWLRAWRAARYRREALAELEALAPALRAGQASALAELNALLKRAALAVWPRAEVAKLTGSAWLRFLDAALGGEDFARGPGRPLGELTYRPPEALARVPAVEREALLDLAGRWLQEHARA